MCRLTSGIDGVFHPGWEAERLVMRESWWPIVGSCLESAIGALTHSRRMFRSTKKAKGWHLSRHRWKSLSSLQAERYRSEFGRLVLGRFERSRELGVSVRNLLTTLFFYSLSCTTTPLGLAREAQDSAKRLQRRSRSHRTEGGRGISLPRANVANFGRLRRGFTRTR